MASLKINHAHLLLTYLHIRGTDDTVPFISVISTKLHASIVNQRTDANSSTSLSQSGSDVQKTRWAVDWHGDPIVLTLEKARDDERGNEETSGDDDAMMTTNPPATMTTAVRRRRRGGRGKRRRKRRRGGRIKRKRRRGGRR